MSAGKGDKRRAGDGYADGWDRVFGITSTQAYKDGQDILNARARAVLDAMPIAEPAKTCANCKHWVPIPFYGNELGNCTGLAHTQMDLGHSDKFCPKKFFGCNGWEGKQ